MWCFVNRSLAFCPFFFWPLCCLFFIDLQILITLWYLQTLLVTIISFTVDGEHGRGIVAWNTGTRNIHKD